jgi:hypothetical protein
MFKKTFGDHFRVNASEYYCHINMFEDLVDNCIFKILIELCSNDDQHFVAHQLVALLHSYDVVKLLNTVNVYGEMHDKFGELYETLFKR